MWENPLKGKGRYFSYNLNVDDKFTLSFYLKPDIIKKLGLEQVTPVKKGLPYIKKFRGKYLYLTGLFLFFIFIFSIHRFFLDLINHEEKINRFIEEKFNDVNPNWIENNLKIYPPELVASVWDGKIDKNEVMVILTKLISNNKIDIKVEKSKSWFRRKVITIIPLIPISEFKGTEVIIKDYFFINGDAPVTINEIKRYHIFNYKKPILEELNENIEDLAKLHPELKNENISINYYLRTFSFSFVAGLLLILGLALTHSFPPFFIDIKIWVILFAIYLYGNKLKGNISLSKKVYKRFFYIVAIYGFFIHLYFILLNTENHLFIPAAVFVKLTILSSMFNKAKSKSSKERIKIRKKIEQARHFLKKEVSKKEPYFSNDMTPYLLALGLKKTNY